jgi:hypothetical protein
MCTWWWASEFVLASLAEEEAEWLTMVDAGDHSARRWLDICRAEIRRIESSGLRADARRSWLVPQLRAIALPSYDHPDFQAHWLLAPATDVAHGPGA